MSYVFVILDYNFFDNIYVYMESYIWNLKEEKIEK